jgi:hypothetical protein
VVGVAPPKDQTTIGTASLTFTEKTLTGSYFGSARPRQDFPRLLALYQAGRLKLDELITTALRDRGSAARVCGPRGGQERARGDRLRMRAMARAPRPAPSSPRARGRRGRDRRRRPSSARSSRAASTCA